MIKNTALHILLFFLFILKTDAKENSVTINVIAQEFKNEKLLCRFGNQITGIALPLDAKGKGSLKLFIKENEFINISAFHNIPYTLYLKPGDKVTLTIENNKGSIIGVSGKSMAINNFFLETKLVLNPLIDFILADTTKNVDEFTQRSEKSNEQLENLYKKYYNSILPDKKLGYLLIANIQAAILYSKEFFLSWNDYTAKEIDSLNLESKLGVENHPLLQDTIAIQYHSAYFNAFLNANCNRYLRQKMYKKEIDGNRFFEFEHESIENATIYSNKIKEYLLFHHVIFYRSMGPNTSVDSIAHVLMKQYPRPAYYRSSLVKLYDEFSHLLPGQPALPLQGISPEGKMYTLNDFKGKVIFVDVWATWCSPCIEAIPHIIKLQEKFKETKEVAFIFLSNNKNNEDEIWKNYLSKHPEFIGLHLRARKEEDRPLEEAWKVTGIPRYMLIDKKGNIIDAFAHNYSYEEIQLMIEKAFKN